MKKLSVILCIVLCICTVFTVPVGATGQKLDTDITYTQVSSNNINNVFEDFVTKNNDRTGGTEKEKNAAKYVADKFYSYGLSNLFGATTVDFTATNTDAEKEKYIQTFIVEQTAAVLYSQNVVAFLPSAIPTADTVIIGAHYDNAYGLKRSGGDLTYSTGAYDNGTGIAVMLSLAEALANKQFSYNIIFVAFGAEEQGLFGSQKFIERIKRDKKEYFDNLLIMFNLDVVGAGDYLYLYTDEVTTEHESFLREVTTGFDTEIKAPPLNKKLMLVPAYFNNVSYSHTGMMSDHAPFYNEGKNVAFFFSMNWETTSKTGTVESEKHPSIMHTSDDNLSIVKQYYGDTYLKYMTTTANVISKSLAYDGVFADAMQKSAANRINYTFWTNSLWGTLILLGIFLIAIGLVVLLYFKYKKKATGSGNNRDIAIEIIEIKNPEATPTADEIFGFGGGRPQSDNNENNKSQPQKNSDETDPFSGF